MEKKSVAPSLTNDEGGWMKFGNNKVWSVGADSTVEGVVKVPGYMKFEDYEDRLDAIAEAVTGSTIGLMGITERYLGNDMVAFCGSVEEMINTEEGEDRPMKIDVNSKEFLVLVGSQYGLLSIEAEHLVSSLGDEYGDEAIVSLGWGRELRCPVFPEECCYVRVCIGGMEIAYWHMDEWRDSPADVMGALVGAMMGSEDRMVNEALQGN